MEVGAPPLSSDSHSYLAYALSYIRLEKDGTLAPGDIHLCVEITSVSYNSNLVNANIKYEAKTP